MVLVTGGTGFVGRALVPALAACGHRVAVLTRRAAPAEQGIEWRAGDLRDPASLARALDGIETVVHLAAALPAAGVPPEAIRGVNVDGTRELARAAARAGVSRFIHGSSAGVYGDGMGSRPHEETEQAAPATPYERSKLEGEAAVIAELAGTDVSWVVLRPSGVQGPGRAATADFYRRIRRQPLWVHGPATVIVQPTDVGDLVQGILRALDRPAVAGDVINIGGAEALRYPDLIGRIARLLGVRVRQLQVPPGPARAAARIGLRAIGHSAALRRMAQPFVNRSVDITRARRLLGFEPSPLDESIERTIAWARRENRL